MLMEEDNRQENNLIQPALLTRTEMEWLLGKKNKGKQLSKSYERKMRSVINKKLKPFAELELPLLLNKGFSVSACPNAANTGSNATDGIYCHALHEIPSGRGSPSLAGRGIANPMSERTRGFEMLLHLGNAKIPLPAPIFLIFL
jgi:hypothetical protein